MRRLCLWGQLTRLLLLHRFVPSARQNPLHRLFLLVLRRRLPRYPLLIRSDLHFRLYPWCRFHRSDRRLRRILLYQWRLSDPRFRLHRLCRSDLPIQSYRLLLLLRLDRPDPSRPLHRWDRSDPLHRLRRLVRQSLLRRLIR